MSPDLHAASITAVVLCGGRGQRMGGADKGMLLLEGRPLAAHVLAAVAPQAAVVAVNANRNRERYAALGVPVIADSFERQLGPLAGMLAGLEFAATPWVLVVPCDMPFLPHDLAARLHRAAAGSSAAYATSGGDCHYTCCLLRTSLAPALRTALAHGTRAVHRFLADCDAVAVDVPDLRPSLNTPAALDAARAA